MLQSIHKSYKVEINPTQRQKEILNKNFGCVRFVYNWCIERFQKESNKDKEDRKVFSKFGYIRKFTYIKNNNKEYDFLIDKDISSQALIQSGLNFASSVNKFFKEGSGCGNIQDMNLNDRVYTCNNIHCIYHSNPIDRDYNSSINIRDYYFKYIRQAMA